MLTERARGDVVAWAVPGGVHFVNQSARICRRWELGVDHGNSTRRLANREEKNQKKRAEKGGHNGDRPMASGKSSGKEEAVIGEVQRGFA